jgi:hypothetical protein
MFVWEGTTHEPGAIWTIAEPDDYVIFKLDVDAYRIERPILQAILHSPDVAARVDELYFEHHVTMPEMTGYWGASAAADEDLRTSVELFTRLRQLGIRAHSWV